MSSDSKQLMREIFAELAKGNGKLFRDSMADDFRWTITGSSQWSGKWQGKQEITDELLRPLLARFADTVYQRGATIHCGGQLCRRRVPQPCDHHDGRALLQRLLLCVPLRRRQAARIDRVHGHRTCSRGFGTAVTLAYRTRSRGPIRLGALLQRCRRSRRQRSVGRTGLGYPDASYAPPRLSQPMRRFRAG